jgi:hypothetical protein
MRVLPYPFVARSMTPRPFAAADILGAVGAAVVGHHDLVSNPVLAQRALRLLHADADRIRFIPARNDAGQLKVR